MVQVIMTTVVVFQRPEELIGFLPDADGHGVETASIPFSEGADPTGLAEAIAQMGF